MKLRVNSYAKINLGLKILNKRSDNYHNIHSIFAQINLSDIIIFSPAKKFSLSSDGPECSKMPLDQSNLSSRYGYRRDPVDHKYKFHDGNDISAKTGTPVYSVGDGVVKKSRYWGSYGNYIEIDHGYGYRTIYGHLSNRKVKQGDKIIRGQKIGEVGNTGKSTAPHLHYEI